MKLLLKNRLPLLVLGLLIGFQVFGQQKMLTLEDAILKQRSSLAPKRLAQLQWVNGSNNVIFINDNQSLVLFNSIQGKIESSFSLKEINLILRSNTRDTLTSWGIISSSKNNTIEIRNVKGIYSFSTNEKSVVTFNKEIALPEKAFYEDSENPVKHIAYTIDNNLWVYNANKKSFKAVTSEKDNNIVCGQSVHRDEFGISKGSFWSPSGQVLAFYRMDQRMVTDYPIMELDNRPSGTTMIKYPMAGNKSHHVTVGLYNMKLGKVVYLKTGLPAEQYLTNIAWAPDEKSIYVAVLNRDQNTLRLNQYDAKSGKFLKMIFEELDEKYVQPLHPMQFLPNNPAQYIWQSKRNGWNHAYLYDLNSGMIRDLIQNKGVPLEVTEVYGFNPSGTELFFQAVEQDKIDRQIYVSSVSTGLVRKLSKLSGTNSASFNSDYTAFINTNSSLKVPKIIDIIHVQNDRNDNLLISDNPMKDYLLGEVELLTLRADDNTVLNCRMIKPIDFDPNKKYPVMVYVYGGPGVQMVTDTWLGGGDMLFQYMAQRGFIVFTMDNRGSANRGKAFEQASFRTLGTNEINDQMKGVDYLKSLSFVDGEKMGVFGWSYGGFMTTSMMTRTPEVFKIGVAGGPVIDWSFYEVMYTERYMDTPATNPDGYAKSSLFQYVDKLKGKLMLIHGTSDDVVVWQHSLKYLKAAVDKGIQLDYFVYPGHLHNVQGRDRVHLMRKVSDYFIDNLK